MAGDKVEIYVWANAALTYHYGYHLMCGGLPDAMSLLARQIDKTGLAEEWRRPERVHGYFIDAPVDDASVVWIATPTANPPWVQAWPDPRPTQQIAASWVDVAGKPGIDKISWEPVVPVNGTGFVPTKGDLSVRYSVQLWYVPGQPVPRVNGVPTWPRCGTHAIETGTALNQRIDGNTWDIAKHLGSLEIGDRQEFAMMVTAHYEFHDGTNPIEQQPAVSRPAYTTSTSPVLPLAAPANPTITWITDTASTVGTRTGEGHFRFAPTIADMLLVQPRVPVEPVHRIRLRGGPERQPGRTRRHHSHKPPGLSPQWVHRTGASRTRCRSLRRLRTVYDFAAKNGQPALTGWPTTTRTSAPSSRPGRVHRHGRQQPESGHAASLPVAAR